jgi:ATP/maltotriose-dependent transcriptional regulator MalT
MGIRIQSLWLARGSWYSLMFLLVTISWGQSAPQSDQKLDSLFSVAEKNVHRNPLEAKSIATSILKEAKLSGSAFYQARALKVLGGSHFIMGDYELALENFLDAYSFFLFLKDSTNASRLLSNVGLVYKNIGDYQASLNYYNQALDFSYVSDTLTNSRLYNNIGVVYQHLEKYDTAEYFLEKSLFFKTILKDKKGMSNALTNLGNIAAVKGNFELALNYHQKSLNLEQEMSSDEGIAKSFNNIGSTYLKMKDFEAASKYAENALRISKKLGTKEQLRQSYETLAICDASRGSFRSAYHYQSLLTETKDSLMNEDVSRKLGQLESRLELASKQSEIEKLAFENEINLLRAEKTRNQLIIAIAASSLIIILLLAIYYQRARKAKAEKMAQESQYDALQKRFIEILNGPQTFELKENLEALNAKLVNPLTEREYDALKLSLQGLTNKEMGDKLFVSDSTVKFHLRNIYNKLGVSNRKEALEYVVKTS